MKEIDISQWTKVGEGGNGSTYENPLQPDVILKVNKPRINTLPVVEREYNVSKAVESVGLLTPRMLEIVKVGESYGTVSERIRNKKSLSRLCHDDPSCIEEMARVLCREGKKLFSTPCPGDRFPSRREQLIAFIDKVKFLSRKNKDLVRAFAATVKENDNCVHGDFQMGNLITSEGKYYWIDLDRFAHGDPMFDIGHLFHICRINSSIKQVQDIFHMNEAQLHRFWDAFAKEYTGKEDHAGFDALAGKYALLDIIVRENYSRLSFAENLFFVIIARRIIKQYYK
ncbi:MAG: TIGR02172 family protein [Bacteroidales bacterium]|nr:TIGR02172 family protein [Bacteroidales bacterium]